MDDHVCVVHSWVDGVFPPETEIIHISFEQGQHFAQWTSEVTTSTQNRCVLFCLRPQILPLTGDLGLILNLHKRVYGLKNHTGDDQAKAKINHQLYHRGRSQSR